MTISAVKTLCQLVEKLTEKVFKYFSEYLRELQTS